jgi:hypothetical protein
MRSAFIKEVSSPIVFRNQIQSIRNNVLDHFEFMHACNFMVSVSGIVFSDLSLECNNAIFLQFVHVIMTALMFDGINVYIVTIYREYY